MPLKRLVIVLVICVTTAGTGLLGPSAAQANGCITLGAGTAQDPFIIANHVNLDCLRTNSGYWVSGYHFKQTADINMSNYLWSAGIGDDTIPFRGTFDGNGYTISGLRITSTGNNVGMFGVAYDDTLTGITLTGLSVTGNQRVGGLVGKKEGGLIEDVSVTGTVIGDSAVGGLIGQVDDSADTTILRSFTAGAVTTSLALADRRVGGLIGNAYPYSRTLSIIDSYSSSAVTGNSRAGGLMGTYVVDRGFERLVIRDSYARGPVTGSFETGGLIGCIYDYPFMQCDPGLTYTITVNDSFWDTQTTGQATTAGSVGRPRTTEQMTSLGNFGNWSITDVTTDQTVWGICTGIESGYPFLQWFAIQEGLACGQTPPPDPTPAPLPVAAAPPRDVAAVPGDRSAVVTWQSPASTGSYPVSTYIATASPGGRTCLTQTTSCEITGLTNGTAYTVTVSALTGAGWSAPSAPSLPVIPRAVTVTIKAERVGRMLVVSGTTTGVTAGTVAQPYLRVGSQPEFTPTATTAIVSADGRFTWSRRINSRQAIRVYVAAAGARSSVVRLPGVR